jgi:hypothetical protein
MDIFGKKRIRELEIANANLNDRLERWEEHYRRFEQLAAQNKVTNLAVARIIAKLDPQYARDEMDPQRKRESDDLSNEIIRKLIAEHRASNPTVQS